MIYLFVVVFLIGSEFHTVVHQHKSGASCHRAMANLATARTPIEYISLCIRGAKEHIAH